MKKLKSQFYFSFIFKNGVHTCGMIQHSLSVSCKIKNIFCRSHSNRQNGEGRSILCYLLIVLLLWLLLDVRRIRNAKKAQLNIFFLLLRHYDEILYLNDMPRKHIYKFQISYFIHFETGIRAYMLVVQALGNSNISYSAK